MSGALPILIGWTATGAPLDMRAWSLVAVMFLWQFPHFMAIAWLYRDDYARGGPADADGRRSDRLACRGRRRWWRRWR